MRVLLCFLIVCSFFPSVLAEQYPEYEVQVDVVADNLSIPWGIDFARDGRIFFTERTGNVKIIDGNSIITALSLDVGEGEGGMLGIALNPNFDANNFVYVYYTYNDLSKIKNKIVRFVEVDNKLREGTVLLSEIPGARYHDGGRIAFGPDQKLYVTTGDAGVPDLSQNIDSLAGKILRLNSDGSIPDDNPFENSYVYSYGHRNPQGIAWDEFGNLFATEHGPSGERGFAHDEVNLTIPGKNYGWPDVISDEFGFGITPPIIHSGDETWAPSGATFYYGNDIPSWHGKFFLAALRGQHIHEFRFENNSVVSHEKLFLEEFGRIRDIVEGPDGLYILTSNTDGRGIPHEDDDKILRISAISKSSNFEKCVATEFSTDKIQSRCTVEDGKHFVEKMVVIPDLIKNNARLWSEGTIKDEDFIFGIKHLVQKDIIATSKISETGIDKIPAWVKNNAKWWSDGFIDDIVLSFREFNS